MTDSTQQARAASISDAAIEAAEMREEAIRIIEACDPGDCRCGKPHRIPMEHQGLISEMVELLKESRHG